MRAARLTSDEQYHLVMECRSSGLSDYQWCTEHGIKPGTFYNWVSRLRKNACYDIPPAASRSCYAPAEKQEVVKLDILPEQSVRMAGSEDAHVLHESSMLPVIEISGGTSVIRITNDISPQLLSCILHTVGGFRC